MHMSILIRSNSFKCCTYVSETYLKTQDMKPALVYIPNLHFTAFQVATPPKWEQ